MTFQIPFLGEPFATYAATVGLLSCVDDVVNPQRRRVGEGLPAQLARLADSLRGDGGDAVVRVQLGPVGEVLLADVAEVGLV